MAVIGIARVQATIYVAGGRIKAPPGSLRVLKRKPFDVGIAAVNFEYVTTIAVLGVQNRVVHIVAVRVDGVRPTDHNGVLSSATGHNYPASGVSAGEIGRASCREKL